VLSLCAQAGADEPTGRQRKQAVAEYKRGEDAFLQGKYRQALEAYEAAHKLAPAALMLFNIARCHQLLGNADEAIRFFQSYLAMEPGGKVADEARRFVEELRALRPADSRSAIDATPKGVQEAEPAAPEPDPASSGSAGRETIPSTVGTQEDEVASRLVTNDAPGGGGARSWLAWTAVGVAVVGAGAAAKFTLDAHRGSEELTEWDEAWPTDLDRRIDDIDSAKRWMVVSSVVAVAATAGAVVLFATGPERAEPRSEQSSTRFRLLAGSRAVQASLGGSF